MLKLLQPELAVDKDGLYDLSELKYIFKPVPFPEVGMFLADHYVIMAHPFFRRGMNEHQNWAPRFIELLWRAEVKTSRIRIALDINRVSVNLVNLLI